MGMPYTFPFACFACHRSFKRALPREGNTRKCPNCAGTAIRMGRHFKAPSADDEKAWAVVRLLVANGFLYDRIYKDMSMDSKASFPATLAEAQSFVQVYTSRLSEEDRMGVSNALRSV